MTSPTSTRPLVRLVPISPTPEQMDEISSRALLRAVEETKKLGAQCQTPASPHRPHPSENPEEAIDRQSLAAATEGGHGIQKCRCHRGNDR
jgi:hypothetical protein